MTQPKIKSTPLGWSLLITVIGFSTGDVQASVWQGSNWALTGEVEAGTGYDSNLSARRGGESDGYAVITPTLRLKRIESLSNLHVIASVKTSTFFQRSDFNSVDPSIKLKLSYPDDDESIPTQEAEAHASRITEASADIGGRLRRDDFGARWEGTLISTGKTSLLARAEVKRQDYLSAGFNTNDTATSGLTFAFVSNERLQLGAGYDFAYDRSAPDNVAGTKTNSRQHAYTLRGRGEFLPKITGRFLVGATDTNYRGSVTRNDWDLVAGASIGWKVTERRELAWKVERMTYFSPNGQAAIHSLIGLEFTQEFSHGFFITLGADTDRVKYRRNIISRSDRSYAGQLQIRYALTGRFSASLLIRHLEQDSSENFGNYERDTFFASAAYRF